MKTHKQKGKKAWVKSHKKAWIRTPFQMPEYAFTPSMNTRYYPPDAGPHVIPDECPAPEKHIEVAAQLLWWRPLQ